jgi:hypothetical protein
MVSIENEMAQNIILHFQAPGHGKIFSAALSLVTTVCVHIHTYTHTHTHTRAAKNNNKGLI